DVDRPPTDRAPAGLRCDAVPGPCQQRPHGQERRAHRARQTGRDLVRPKPARPDAHRVLELIELDLGAQALDELEHVPDVRDDRQRGVLGARDLHLAAERDPAFDHEPIIVHRSGPLLVTRLLKVYPASTAESASTRTREWWTSRNPPVTATRVSPPRRRTRSSPVFSNVMSDAWRGRMVIWPSAAGATTESTSPSESTWRSAVTISSSRGIDYAFASRSAFSRACSIVPTIWKACSGRSSCLPSRISRKPRTVSILGT